MRKYIRLLFLAGTIGIGLTVAQTASAHCEVPCGIYGDQMRIAMLTEDIQTVEKAMQQIKALGATAEKNDNQLIRWVTTKETHADKIQEIVYQYFMTQRIKPVDNSNKDEFEKYVTKITLLHQMLVESMKCKQTTDESHVTALRSLVEAFGKAYFVPEEHKHE